MKIACCFNKTVDIASECIICFDDLITLEKQKINIFVIYCGHVLCENCLLSYNSKALMKKKCKCPVCRTNNHLSILYINKGKCLICKRHITQLKKSSTYVFSLLCGHVYCETCMLNLESSISLKLKDCRICKTSQFFIRLFI